MTRNFSKKAILIFGILTAATTFNSCVAEDDLSTTEPTRYTANDIKSYADLFRVFWTVMDQQYNYFYEQKRNDGMDWDAVYREYYPKFQALQTFNTGNDKDIIENQKIARQYFTDIIDPIIDRHFAVGIKLPYSKGVEGTFRFSGGMKSPVNNQYDFKVKTTYMADKLGPDAKSESMVFNNPDGTQSTFTYQMGSLKSNPDTYYFSFNMFSLSAALKINLLDAYLKPDSGNGLVLTPDIIKNSVELNSISDATLRNKVENFTIDILNQWNNFPNSADVKSFNNYISTFKDTEVISDAFLDVTKKSLEDSKKLVAYNKSSTYPADVLTSESKAYIAWFVSQMDNHAKWAYGLPSFQDAAQRIIDKSPFYKQFFNALHKGEIKKIIIDLRANGGGAIADARFWTDRFITKNALAGYQRTKEGNGRFNYTPWVPMHVNPHKFGIPSDIPTVILTDRGSVSMSEISTLMLKSQGPHVISIGDYSAGGLAALTGSDEFNGGAKGEVAGYLSFYMPVMAHKDAKGEVIEGIGIKPDIYVAPPSNAELLEMKNSPKTFADRVLQAAIKYISTK
ncbi:S41 family peptidase [Chryseobacterium tructae]|uniref:S41 family peptidase n=1 Tax=Chryseobacterium tructae TaxID=1037380 RepID=A0ABV7XUX0_9FLAO|nr:S41 family peptidase [Chryseobacterium tructae]MDN3692514.1 S41 family peptidase [Chryseobacterium tructae]